MKDQITPEHYGGADNPYEVIKVINAWDLGFELGNVCKYIARSGKKDKSKHIEDLEKAKKYLELEITKLKEQEQPYTLKDTGNIFERYSNLDTKYLEKRFWGYMKTALEKSKPTENKEPTDLLDKASEEMDKLSGEELLDRTATVVYHYSKGLPDIQMIGPDAVIVCKDSCSEKEFKERCKKVQEWADSKKNRGISIEELAKFCENLFK